MISYPDLKSSASSRAHSPESIDALARRLHTQFELESQAFLLQCRSPTSREIGPEAIRLYKELNSVKARRNRKVEELRRVKERLGYENCEGLMRDMKPGEQRERETLQTRLTALEASLEAVNNKLILEERATESLKSMLEKVTKAQLLMRQRTTELISIRSTMNRHLASATLARDRAAAHLTETHSEQKHFSREMTEIRERFRTDLGKKAAIATRIAYERQAILDRVCTAVCDQVVQEERESTLIQQLETEINRKRTDTKDLQKAETDKKAFSHKFGIIEDILVRQGCQVGCRSGLSSGVVRVIIEQFSIFQVVQGSLASRYSQLAQDLTDKEKQLSSLLRLFESLKEMNFESKRSLKEPEKGKLRPVVEAEQTGLSLYVGVITLLGTLVAARERIEPNAEESGWNEIWTKAKSAVNGFKRKGKEHSSVVIRTNKRHPTIANAFHPRGSSLERLSPLPTPESSHFAQYIPLSASDIDLFLHKTVASSEDKTAIRYLFEYDKVVKCFADAEMLTDVLRYGKYAHIYEDIIGKAHTALKIGLKEMVNLAKLALQDLARKEDTQEVPKGLLAQQINEKKPSPLRTDTRRRTEKSLLKLRSDDSPDLPPNSLKRSSIRQLSLSSDKQEIEDSEAMEELHIREERAKARSAHSPQSPKKPEASRSASRLARDENPYSERKRLFIREFLHMERKLSEVKLTERQSLQSRSPVNSRGYQPFQLLPWLPSSRAGSAAGRGRHCRSP